MPAMSARSFFRAAMFLLVQLAGINLAHAKEAACTDDPDQFTPSCPQDPPNQPCYQPPCPNS